MLNQKIIDQIHIPKGVSSKIKDQELLAELAPYFDQEDSELL